MSRPTLIFSLCLCCLAHSLFAIDLPSPSQGVVLRVQTDGQNRLVYSVLQDGKMRLEQARLGITVDGIDLGSGVTLGEARTRAIRETFPWRGNKTLATNSCVASEVTVRLQSGQEWTLEARVFDDGVGFRYRVPGSGRRHIEGEATTWQLPKDAVLWLQTNTGDYEGAFHSRRADEVPTEQTSENRKGPLFLGPPVTVAYAGGGYGLISEAALYRYSGMTLRPEGSARFRAAFEDDPRGWDNDGPVLSPWRVILLAPDLNALVNNDVIAALCDPPDPALFPQGMNTEWIRPGKAPCTWMVFGNDGAQWDRQKWFVDISAATGCEYLLVDAGWRTEKWGWLKDGGDVWARAAELCRYAAERNVGIVLWHAYPEGRDDGPGLTTVEAREELFRNCRKAGVKGIKIDFFNSESRKVIEDYEDLLRRSAKYQLMINFHGANKPAGEARTWPHEVTREGIREQEYVLWGSLPLEHYGALPFTRMVVGHADFLPGYVQSRFLKNTTAIFQLASTVVFSSPFLCWPDNPEAYLASPLLQFIRTVPVTWDETRILPGSEIGRTVLMARRKADDWFISAMNCRPETQSLELDLSAFSLPGRKLTMYSDGEGSAFQIRSEVTPPADGKLPLTLRSGGGAVIQVASPKKFSGWK